MHIQDHAAVYELHGRHAVCEDRHGATSLVTLQCLRNLAQGYCMVGDLCKAEEQLKKAQQLVDGKLLHSASTHAGDFDVIKVGIMLDWPKSWLSLTGEASSVNIQQCTVANLEMYVHNTCKPEPWQRFFQQDDQLVMHQQT